MIHPLRLLPLIAALLVSGCGLLPDAEDETKGWSQQRLFGAMKEALDDQRWEDCGNYGGKLLARYPFGRMAQQSFLDKAYCHYKGQEPDAGLATLDRFFKSYPRHPYADYAYYLRGVINFNRGRGLLQRYLNFDESQRDPGAAIDSFYDFEKVVTRFPDSRYAEDSRLRMLYLRNNLAEYEVAVADWYMRRQAYLAAANRAKTVVENYQRTPHQEQALQLMIAAYDALGLEDLKADSVRVLKRNFPNADPGAYSTEEPSIWKSLNFLFDDKEI
ncbi:MAG: outer membrane protein assembly factor BamD [Gammaproteobacteria bacterium]